MPTLKQYVPLLNLVGKLAVPVLYIVAFASKEWVKSDNKEWGLWTWCYTNFSDDTNVEDYVNDTSRCHSISAGDSPSYYEVVRTIGTFTMVFYCFHFFNWDEKDNSPAFLSFLTVLGAVTTLAILGDHYENDERWKDQHPALGWCFWAAVACAVLSFCNIYVFYKFQEHKRASSNVSQSPRQNGTSRPTNPNPNPNPNPPPQRSSQQRHSSSMEAGGKSTVIFHTFTGRDHGGAAPSLNSSSSSSSSSSISSWQSAALSSAVPAQDEARGVGGGNCGGAGQFPVLQLPRYEMSRPLPPPPSYEDAIGGGDGGEGGGGAVSPPPAYTVTDSGVHRDG